MCAAGPDPSTTRGMSQGDQWHSEKSSPTAPLGIKLICVLQLFFDLLILLVALAGVGAGGPAGAIATVLLALVAVDFAAVYGLWTLKSWGWVLAVVLGSVFLFADLVQVNVVSLLVGLLILGYIVSKRRLYTD